MSKSIEPAGAIALAKANRQLQTTSILSLDQFFLKTLILKLPTNHCTGKALPCPYQLIALIIIYWAMPS